MATVIWLLGSHYLQINPLVVVVVGLGAILYDILSLCK